MPLCFVFCCNVHNAVCGAVCVTLLCGAVELCGSAVCVLRVVRCMVTCFVVTQYGVCLLWC